MIGGSSQTLRRPCTIQSELPKTHFCMPTFYETNIRESQGRDINATIAVYLDLENIALGARDAHYPAFDIRKVLERLLLKGHIVVKKAYCDFDRYKEFKKGLHEAAFELIEIPHVRTSGAFYKEGMRFRRRTHP